MLAIDASPPATPSHPNPMSTDPARWSELGYCAFPQLFSAAEVAAMNEGLLAAELDAPTYFGEPHTRYQENFSWLDVCRHPKLLDAIESVIGPDILLVYSSFFIKPADGLDVGGAEVSVAWHQVRGSSLLAHHHALCPGSADVLTATVALQDNNYWGAVHGTEGVITVWLPLDDVDTTNGTMMLLPRTHRPYEDLPSGTAPAGSIVSRMVEVAPAVEATAVPLLLQAGGISIHDSYLLHGSGYNRSGRRRAAYTIRYLNPRAGYVDVTQHPVSAYLVRGEAGAQGGGYTDARPGMPPALFASTEEYTQHTQRPRL
jgi:non-heme Fe2+,alpha-ketoglutarate-dependent halogenase